MWSFKSIIKHPVVASTLAILIATPILKFTGNLPLVWNWLKIWVVRLLTVDIPVWIIMAIGLIVLLLKKLLKKKNQSEPQHKPLTDTEKRILRFLADGDNEFVNITDIAHRLDKMKLVIETTLESLEELDLVSRGGEYRELYRLSKKGRELVIKQMSPELK